MPFLLLCIYPPAGLDTFLIDKLQPLTSLKCVLAVDGATILENHIYFSPRNVHLLIKKGNIILGKGPEESRWRPSIDILFRSAAAAYNTRSIGIILTGLLDDGMAGMLAIKKSGGTLIVQDPNEAEYRDMPESVLNNMKVDYSIPLIEMAPVIYLITRSGRKEIPAPREVILESEIAEKVVITYNNVKEIAEIGIYSCPDCGGGLWKMKKNDSSEPERYRCHIGHSYSEKDLSIKQGENFEKTLWIALRIMEERRNLLIKMHDDNFRSGLTDIALNYNKKVKSLEEHISKMKEILFDSKITLNDFKD